VRAHPDTYYVFFLLSTVVFLAAFGGFGIIACSSLDSKKFIRQFKIHFFKIPHKINNNFRVRARGLPNPRTNVRGDLIVEFDVRFPDSISPAAKELIQNALPPN